MSDCGGRECERSNDASLRTAGVEKSSICYTCGLASLLLAHDGDPSLCTSREPLISLLARGVRKPLKFCLALHMWKFLIQSSGRRAYTRGDIEGDFALATTVHMAVMGGSLSD